MLLGWGGVVEVWGGGGDANVAKGMLMSQRGANLQQHSQKHLMDTGSSAGVVFPAFRLLRAPALRLVC